MTAPSNPDRPLFGILMMLGFCALIPIADGLAKLLGTALPLAVLLLARSAVQAAILVPLSLATGRSLRLTRRVTRFVVLRTALQLIALAAMFASLRYLPLAEAIAIAFVMPFILLILGARYLGEEVGLHRLGACAVGFVGTLLVVQPNFAAVGAPALLPLVVALAYALFMLVTRAIAHESDPVAVQAVTGAMSLGVTLLLVAAVPLDDLSLAMPDVRQWILLVVMGAVGTAAHLLMTWSLRFAPSATLAPMQYLEIPFSTAVGYLMFTHLPNGLAAAGIVVTMAAGLYIIARERRLSVRDRAIAVPPAVP